jgi:Tol biopolymer transport system component
VAWFQDGTKLLVSGLATLGREMRAIWVVSTVTGSLHLLREGGWGSAIAPDGAQIAFQNTGLNELWLMGVNGEDARKLMAAGEGYGFERVAWSPDGQRLAYMKTSLAGDESSIETLDLKSGQVGALVSDRRLKDFVWAPDGRILYSLSELPPNEYDANLWEIRINSTSAKVTGKPKRITNWPGFAVQDLSITADGKRLAFLNRYDQSDVYVGELEAGGARLNNCRRLTLDERIDWPGGWERDGKSILFFSDRNGNLDLYRQELQDPNPETVLATGEDKRWPQLSPGGSWILYLGWTRTERGSMARSGRLMRLPVSGGPSEIVLEAKDYPGSVQVPRLRGRLTVHGYPDFRCASAPTGPCVLAELGKNELVLTRFDPIQGRKEEIARREMTFWDLSPDGSLIAFGKQDRQSGRISILRLADKTIREITVQGWANLDWVGWAADRKGLFATAFATRGSSLLHVDLNGKAQLLRKITAYIDRPLASPDGRYLAFGETSSNSNAWIIDFP